jgi:hypothetical protein
VIRWSPVAVFGTMTRAWKRPWPLDLTVGIEAGLPSQDRTISDLAGNPDPVTMTRCPTVPLEGESSISVVPA